MVGLQFRRSRHLASGVAALVAVVTAACGGGGEVQSANSVNTLARALESAGLRVTGPDPTNFLEAGLFPVPGVSLTASGEKVLAYEFETAEAAAAAADDVSSDGWGIGFKYVNWTSTPHYYARESLLVIYDGDTALMKRVLSEAMGQQFAGGNAPG